MNPVSSRKYYRSLAPLLPAVLLNTRPSWKGIFGRDAPMDLEIGFGNGEFLNRKSLLEPGRDFVGLEISWPSVKRALRRLGNPPRTNARLICLPAGPALSLYFPEKSISVARALFPVPWPKEKHAKKRLFSRRFMDLLASRLVDGGAFRMVTDDPVLARWTLEESLDSALPLALEEREESLDTKYGRKWETRGARAFYYMEGVKAFHPDIPDRGTNPGMQPTFMDALDPETYSPGGISGETAVVFREFVWDPRRAEGLLNVKVVEGDFIQEFFIRMRRDPDGRYRLYPALAHQVFPTEGVRKALELAAAGPCPAHEDPAGGSGGPEAAGNGA
ncbi:MAG: hypothetical protein LBQ79_07660 [Deltaproteobacteria bacterium]|jgi:tRNA (guanine-N7-)-methyltransferase|nr:hypothetical protein [Deltaproteobacteria bacterium]